MQESAFACLLLNVLPPTHSVELCPLISIGVVQAEPVHFESMIGEPQKEPRLKDRLQLGDAWKSVNVM